MNDLTPDFTPVAPRARHDGWSADRQRRFLAVLAETGCVSDAAAAVGMKPRSAYRLRARPDAETFHRAWDAALIVASQRLTTLAFERAVNGTVRKVWHRGEVVGEERVPSDRLLIFLLRHLDAMRFGNLSGLMSASVEDPRATARSALPGLIDAVADNAEPADPLEPADYGDFDCDPQFDMRDAPPAPPARTR